MIISNNYQTEVQWQLVDSFHPENVGDTFFRNVGSNKTHTASHPRT
jgi:hypothetical protein